MCKKGITNPIRLFWLGRALNYFLFHLTGRCGCPRRGRDGLLG